MVGVLAWALWALAMLSLVLNWWQDHLLRQAGRPDLAPLGAAVVAPVLAAVSAATVGAVLASRRPRHPVALAAALVSLWLRPSARSSLDQSSTGARSASRPTLTPRTVRTAL